MDRRQSYLFMSIVLLATVLPSVLAIAARSIAAGCERTHSWCDHHRDAGRQTDDAVRTEHVLLPPAPDCPQQEAAAAAKSGRVTPV